MIPKILHHIWIGAESLRPQENIDSWQRMHPTWRHIVWGNDSLGLPWVNRKHMSSDLPWCGVADLMRYEILESMGGVYVDADSTCLRPLPDWLLECEAFAAWENEVMHPGLISNGFLGCSPGNPLMRRIIADLHDKPIVTDDVPWKVTGPLRLTKSWVALAYLNLTVLPSHFFMPHHYTDASYSGGGPVYATHHWGTTFNSYRRPSL